MAIVAVPDIETAGNAARLQQARHMAVLAETVIVPSTRKEIRAVAIAVKLPRRPQVRNVVRRNVEVNILIVITVKEAAKVKGSAHRKKSGEFVRMTQRNVDRVVAAKAAAQ